MRDKRSWLQRIMWIYDYKWPSSITSASVVFLYVLGVLANFLQVSGVSGGLPLFVKASASVLALLAVVVLLTFPLRWWLLFRAVKDFINKAALLSTLTSDKILVGHGPGGAIAVGMVAKAIRVLGYEPPSIIVVDHRYQVLGSDPRVGALMPSELRLPPDKCWLIQGHIGTGKSLQKLKDRLGLEKAHVLAFVISDSAERRERVDAALTVGSRNVLPWPTEKPFSA